MANQKLLNLLESGEFDWDNIAHRQAFLKAWVNDKEFREMGWFAEEPGVVGDEDA